MPYVTLDFTPNPNTLKYVTDVQFSDRVYNFRSKEDAGKADRVAGLFEVPGVMGILVGKSFVTILRDETSDIEKLHDALMEHLNNWASSGEKLSLAMSQEREISPVERKIVDFIESTVRPAVEQDGGNIVFEKFENGVVYLSLEGSCQSCPSAVATLKLGIEHRLKEILPEVLEVVAV